MVGRTAPIRKADRERFEALKQMPCPACIAIGVTDGFNCGPVEIHHLLSGNKRRGHQFTIGLGSWHHRGVPPNWITVREATAVYGPSLALQSKAFRERFGSDQELLAEVNAKLEALLPDAHLSNPRKPAGA